MPNPTQYNVSVTHFLVICYLPTNLDHPH